MIARTLVIARREFAAYFATPLAAVFLVIFLFLAGLFTFNIGSFYERGQADLRPFFQFHPWLFLFLVPAVSMRLWAEERRTGTIELLTTLPFRLGELVVGKFLAAWGFTLVALALTPSRRLRRSRRLPRRRRSLRQCVLPVPRAFSASTSRPAMLRSRNSPATSRPSSS
jgi:hypothetical protein